MATGFIGNQNAIRSYSEYFSGDNATLAFLLSQGGYNINGAVSLRVNIFGVAQPPSSFAISGKALTFFTAPPTGVSNIEVVHMVPYLNELNPLQQFTFVDSMTTLNVVTLTGTSQTFARSNTSSLNATAAYIQSLDAVNFRGAIEAKNYPTLNAAIAAATTNANTLFVTSNMALQATSTVPPTVHLVFTSNGSALLSAGTNLWIQGPLTAPPTKKIFAGTGTANGFNAVPEAYTEWWGATRDGVSDDTVAFESAMVACANTTTLKLLAGTYILNVANYTISESTIRLSGQGESSRVMLPNTGAFNGSLFTITGTNIIAAFDHITFDQQSQIQLATSDNQGLRFEAKGTLTNTSGLIVESCTFRNGCLTDIGVQGGDAGANTATFVIIRGNKFLGGQEGTSTAHDPRSVNISTPCNYVIEGNFFDLMRDRVAYGRAGIVTSDGWVILANSAVNTNDTMKGVIVGNHLKRMGRSEINSTLGAIDPYNFGMDVVIADNVVLDSFGRGIQMKAECRRCSITGNLVDGLANGIGALIAINSSPDYMAGGTILIQGNVLANNPYGDGLVCTGVGVQEGTGITFQSRATSVAILNNIIKDVAGAAIDQSYHYDIRIHDNTISNANYGIDSSNTLISLSIQDNSVMNCVAYGIVVDSATRATVSVRGNQVRDIFGNEGIAVLAGKGIIVTDNWVQNTKEIGIQLTNTFDYGMINDNYIDTTGLHGIWTSASNRVVVRDNILANVTGIGIYCQGGNSAAATIVVSGNRVAHVQDEGIRTDSFQTIQCEDNFVFNVGTGTSSSGIYAQIVGQSATYIGNRVTQTGSAGITTTSSNVGVKLLLQGNQTDNTVNYGLLTNSPNVAVCIQGNQVANVSTLGRGIYVAANVAGQITGNWCDPLTVSTPFHETVTDGYHSVGLNSWNATQGYGTAAPTSGIWKKNDIIWNTNAAASGNIGFVCTVAGSPGTWKNFGPIGA